MFVWLLGCFAALAGEAQLKVLVMPLTPADDYQTEFHALIPRPGAQNEQWAASHSGFECVGNDDFVEVWVRKPSWPSEVPKKVVCTGTSGSVSAKVRIIDRNLEPMFVADGSLVMPRTKGESAIYKGPPPRQDFGVQQGRTGSLNILCKIEAGPVLEVTAYPLMEDGKGRCLLQTKLGEKIDFPVVIRTIKRAQ